MSAEKRQHKRFLPYAIAFVLTVATVLPLFLVSLERPAWSETTESASSTDLVDITSAISDPQSQSTIENIKAWIALRNPDLLSLPNREFGFLATLPKSTSVPEKSNGFNSILSERRTVFHDVDFNGIVIAGPAEMTPVVLQGKEADISVLPQGRRTWEPQFAIEMPSGAPFKNAPAGIAWVSENGAPLKNAPSIADVSDAERQNAAITTLELIQGGEMPAPRIVVRQSCGNHRLDTQAVNALAAFLRANRQSSSHNSNTLVNVLWNLK